MANKIKVTREKLLSALKIVQPGLISKKGLVEQGNHVIFRNGRIQTFNDHLFCQVKFNLGGLEGAVRAGPVIGLLENMDEEYIHIIPKKNKLRILSLSKDKGAEFLFDKVALQTDSVEIPNEWDNLSGEFANAITLVQECASKNADEIQLASIHLHPDKVEATDMLHHYARFTIKLPIKRSVLVPEFALKHVAGIEPTYISYKSKASWIHFSDKSKRIIYSCRCTQEKFIDTSSADTDPKGTPTTLPKGLAVALKRADLFSSEQPINKVIIDMLKDTVRVRGLGIGIKFFEIEDCPKYKGEAFSFVVSPKLMIDMMQKHTECFISDRTLRVELTNFLYLAKIGKVNGDEWGKK